MSLIECIPHVSPLGEDTGIIIMTGLFMIAVTFLIFRIKENNQLKKFLGIDWWLKNHMKGGIQKMTKFKIGDVVIGNLNSKTYSVTTKDGTYEVVGISGDKSIEIKVLTHEIHKSTIGSRFSVKIDSFDLLESFKGRSKDITNVESSNKNQMDKETLKTFSKDNLAEGKRKAEEDKASYEATESKNAYKKLVDRKEEQERKIKVAKEELKVIGDDLKVFD